jgi:flagellar basal-body rod modification protein FlgD
MQTAALASASTQPQTSAARTSLASNYETFLKLLTSQLQNQDPLSPTDSTEFTNQLVQFSSVEQQISTNDQLKQLIALQTNSATNSALGWIGKGAELNSASARLPKEGDLTWRIGTDSSATRTKFEVLDSSGRVVRTVSRNQSGDDRFVWDGKSDAGQRSTDGIFTLRVTNIASDGTESVGDARVVTRISGVEMGGPSPLVTTPVGDFELSRVSRITE